MRAFLLSVTLFVAASACGPRWYYPHLDWLLPWYVADYITLAPGQKTDFERRLLYTLDWHCRSELPAYADFLREVQQNVDQAGTRLSKQQIREYYSTIRFHYFNLINKIGPEIAPVLASASDAQIEELFENLEARNRELASRYVDPPASEILERRYARMIDRLAPWIGDLNAEQKNLVREWSQDLGPDNGPWIANRRRVQQALQDLLRLRHQDPDFASRFTALIASSTSVQSAAYRRRSALRTTLTIDFLAQLAGTLTARQRDHLKAYLGTLADDFDRLACEPDPPQQATRSQDKNPRTVAGPVARP